VANGLVENAKDMLREEKEQSLEKIRSLREA
jgi:hypothetical protein